MDFLNPVLPIIAWTVCIILFAIPALFVGVFMFSMLGHLTQLVFKKSSLRVERT